MTQDSITVTSTYNKPPERIDEKRKAMKPMVDAFIKGREKDILKHAELEAKYKRLIKEAEDTEKAIRQLVTDRKTAFLSVVDEASLPVHETDSKGKDKVSSVRPRVINLLEGQFMAAVGEDEMLMIEVHNGKTEHHYFSAPNEQGVRFCQDYEMEDVGVRDEDGKVVKQPVYCRRTISWRSEPVAPVP